jgi:Family of unknown function (DUF6049)
MAMRGEQPADFGHVGNPRAHQRGGRLPLFVVHGHGPRHYRQRGLGANGNNIPGVHGVLAAKAKRRILSVAAVFAVPAMMAPAIIVLASPAQASPAQASPARLAGTGRVSVTISAMNPQYARPGATVNLIGTVTNGTRQTAAGLQVQLATSSVPFTTRDNMDSYLANGEVSGLVPAGRPVILPASVAPGATASWSASFQVGTQGISGFGVYPVAAQLQDSFTGELLASGQTLLPFWPGQQAAGLQAPLNISWLWPLIDQPHHQACNALTNNDLTTSVGPGGRLSTLLAAGISHPGADLTWVVDPALLGDVATMTKRYQVGGSSFSCTGGQSQPASRAAASWLTSVKAATAGQPTVITPYADVDIAALVHHGLNADLASAYRTGDAMARSVLGRVVTPTIAWPAGGTADLSVLTTLAAADHIGAVVLNSSEMPPLRGPAYHPDDAVTSIPTAAGTTMNVLLSDDTLTSVLRAGNTNSGTLSRSAEFAVKQRFLAETAMIAAELPGSTRSIVVAPPAGWSPSQQLADDLLGETHTPWLRSATLRSLTTAPDTERAVARHAPSQASSGELSAGYLSQVSSISTQLSVYKSVLYHAPLSYLQSLDEALSASESAAWRGGGKSRGVALRSNLFDYLRYAEGKIKIINSAEVPMAGAAGPVPVSIQNGLHEAVEVRLNVSVVKTPRATSPLTIGRFKNLIIIQPEEATAPIRLPVSSAPQGSTVLQLSLSSADGTPLSYTRQPQLTVQSTRYGRAILFLIGAAIGVFVLTSLYRGVRRRLRADSHVVYEEPDPPGSVVTGTSARHPTEAPDDLADARRWADDA